MGLITTALIAGAVILTVITFWDEIIDGLKRALAEVMRIVRGILYGTKVLLQKVDGILTRLSKHYSYEKSEDQWYETTKECRVSANDVPPEIRAKVDNSYGNAVDITKDVELQLQNYS